MFSGVAILMFSSLPGCQNESKPEVESGKVEATQAYLDNFGEPPQGKAGRAYARVGYLPSITPPHQLQARPIFVFSRDDELLKILEKLISGDLISELSGTVYNPFPSDLSLNLEPVSNSTLTIHLSTPQDWQDDVPIAVRALTETALQFDAVQRVKVSINGAKPKDMPEHGYIHDRELIGHLDPPTLLLILGVWETGNEDPEEILVEFDRPVKVNSFELLHESGEKVQGDYYKSIFQMAVVVHPKDPSLYKEGTVLKVNWSVEDDLGRSNSGSEIVSLKKVIH